MKKSYHIFNYKNATYLLAIAYFIAMLFINLSDHGKSVLPAYAVGAHNWLHSQALYDGTGQGFIYLPQSAILYIPFFIMPKFILTQMSFLAFWMVSLLYCIVKLAKFLDPKKADKIAFFTLLFTLALGFDTLRNGQLNIALLVLGLGALLAIYQNKWWLAAGLLALALAFKPTILVLYLLCLALYPALRLKALAMLIVIFILPFLTQTPVYVVHQYLGGIQNLQATFAVGTEASGSGWAQLFNVLNLFSLSLSGLTQNGVRLLFSLLTLILCYHVTRSDLTSPQKVMLMYTFAMMYLLLFNPRTEGNDYILLGPSLGLFWYQLTFVEKKIIGAFFLGLILIGILASYYIALAITPHNGIWMSPFMGCIFALLVLYYYSRKSLRENLFRLERISVREIFE